MTEVIAQKSLGELGIVFKSVKFKNFMSFGNIFTEVNLEGSGTTLLMGENLDKGGSSGAGKSTLINAISYCLYDKIPAGVSKDRLINRTNDKKITKMEVDLTFTKGEDSYIVKRWRGGSTGCQLLMNDADITPASVNRGEDSFNAKVEEILGFSYNLFSQIILFNGNSLPFLDLSVSQQRALIEELFRITMLTRKANALKKMISDLEKNISMQKLLIQQQQKQNEIHQKHVSEASTRVLQWNIQRDHELNSIQKKMEASEQIDFDTEELLLDEATKLRSIISDIQSKIREQTAAHDSALRELKTQKASKERETSPIQAQLTIMGSNLVKMERDLVKIDAELKHLKDAKCPYCLQQFKDATAKIDEMTANKETLNTEIALLTKKNDDMGSELCLFNDKKQDEILNIEALIKNASQQFISEHQDDLTRSKTSLDEILVSLTFTDMNSLLKAKSEIVMLQARLEKMITETNPHVEAHEALVKEGEVVVDLEALNNLENLQAHQQFLLKLLTDKNSFIRKNIISKTIPFLNKRIAYYTESVNLPHIVLFQPDMSCEITQIGRDLDHGNLSNGEKKMLNLSLCLAFRDVLTYLHSKVNVLFTDEVDGGSISGPDVDGLITMLKSKAWDDDISIFIISHRPEFDGRCDNNFVIRKEGGFSTLILQPDA